MIEIKNLVTQVSQREKDVLVQCFDPFY